MALQPAADDGVLRVSELTRRIKQSLESEFPALWVRGEITGLKRADSGHLYFALKEDKLASIDCVVWRLAAIRLGFEPRNGDEVEAFGSVSVYEPRGQYQLVARELRRSGLGIRLQRLEELKLKLKDEGLFDADRKRPLPRFPRRVGIVTSPVGAAVNDMVKVLRARWPGIRITIAPVRVQGEGAAVEIAGAIRRFSRLRAADVLIVGRGGGSVEDLWAFNEELVVRALAASAIPTVSAVGHEVDWTLADSVADVRAATPSHAAEIVVRDAREVRRHVDGLAAKAQRVMRHQLDLARRRLDTATGKYGFRRQRDALGPLRQRIDELTERVRGMLDGRLRGARERLQAVLRGYGLREWPRRVAERRAELERWGSRGDEALRRRLAGDRRLAIALADRLRALSPRLVLERGFCIARAADGTLVRGVETLVPGAAVTLEFARGEADARIEAVRPRGADGAETQSG